MPPLAYGHHLISWLFEVGPATKGDDGLAPVSFSELKSWSELTVKRLSAWESSVIRRLSVAYVAQASKAEQADAPAPWGTKKQTQAEKYQSVFRDAQKGLQKSRKRRRR